MSDTPEEEDEDTPKKKSKLPLILGLVLALVGGGGSFFAIYSGMLFGGDTVTEVEDVVEADVPEGPEVEFVPVEPMTISIGPVTDGRHLRFRAQLEVPKGQQAAVSDLMPRVVDVLNTYLRALKLEDLEHPAVLTRLRSQMLRRVQLVAGSGKINDLLVMEFIVN